MKTKRIGIEALEKGMYVCGMERAGCGPVFLANDMLVRSQDDLKMIAGKGYTHLYVSVDDEPPRPLRIARKVAEPPARAHEACRPSYEALAGRIPAAAEASAPLEPETFVEFEEELAGAHALRGEAERLVRGFLQDARLGKPIEAEKVSEAVGGMVESVFRNQDALTSLARLKSYDDYTFAHSVNVCILSLALGRHMGLDSDRLHCLGTGAILHDIGKVLVPAELLNRKGALSEEEFEQVKRHAELGGAVLSSMSCIDDSSLHIVLQHHERRSGGGYFQGLSGEAIHPFARIASIADSYDAMTSERVYQKAMAPEDALRRLYQMRGASFEPELVERLIRCLGVYPIGTFVELSSGEIAVVKMVRHSHPLSPRVLLLSGADGRPLAEPVEADLFGDDGRRILRSSPQAAACMAASVNI